MSIRCSTSLKALSLAAVRGCSRTLGVCACVHCLLKCVCVYTYDTGLDTHKVLVVCNAIPEDGHCLSSLNIPVANTVLFLNESQR